VDHNQCCNFRIKYIKLLFVHFFLIWFHVVICFGYASGELVDPLYRRNPSKQRPMRFDPLTRDRSTY